MKQGGGAHLTKPGWSKPHTHSNPTNLALFRHKITLYRFNQVGSYYCRRLKSDRRGWAPRAPRHFNHCPSPSLVIEQNLIALSHCVGVRWDLKNMGHWGLTLRLGSVVGPSETLHSPRELPCRIWSFYYYYYITYAQLMLTNPHDVFKGQSRSPNMAPFDMLGIASY